MDGASWTNEAAIARWSVSPREFLASLDPDGGFAKRHLINPTVFRLLGDIDCQRILDAGCGQGLPQPPTRRAGRNGRRGRTRQVPVRLAVERELELGQGIRYVQAATLPDLGTFDAVVASMVLCAIPDWQPAMRACVEALVPGGLFIVTLNHPCFEGLAGSWAERGHLKVDRYLHDYEIVGPHGTDFHRPLALYLNGLTTLGCRLVELVEPALSPDALTDNDAGPGAEAYLELPNFVVIACRR